MPKISDKSGSYGRIGTAEASSDSGSDSPVGIAPGIGTRISAVASRLENRKSAADVMGVSTDSLQRYIREDVQPTFEAVARLCLATGTSLAWMATGKGEDRQVEGHQRGFATPDTPPSHTEGRISAKLVEAIEIVKSGLELLDYDMTPEGKAQLVEVVYGHLVRRELTPAQMVASVLKSIQGAVYESGGEG